jgi:hypothetical protein
LDVDYTLDGNALVFEPNNASGVTLDDGFVTINPGTYIKLTQGLPAYIKHTGDQSWVVNFRTDTTGATRFVVHTAPTDGSREDTFLIRTGILIIIYGNFITFTTLKGPNDQFVNIAVNIGEQDLSVNENSVVVTYRRADHMSSVFFNGVFKGQVSAPASDIDRVIDWSTADNLYVNKEHRFTPNSSTYYHKISVYDKVLTLEEIEDIYDEAQL